jgi:hypothetical protein
MTIYAGLNYVNYGDTCIFTYLFGRLSDVGNTVGKYGDTCTFTHLSGRLTGVAGWNVSAHC